MHPPSLLPTNLPTQLPLTHQLTSFYDNLLYPSLRPVFLDRASTIEDPSIWEQWSCWKDIS